MNNCLNQKFKCEEDCCHCLDNLKVSFSHWVKVSVDRIVKGYGYSLYQNADKDKDLKPTILVNYFLQKYSEPVVNLEYEKAFSKQWFHPIFCKNLFTLDTS